MSNTNTAAKLEALVYVDSSRNPSRTINEAYIGNHNQVEIDAMILALKAQGREGVRALTWAELEDVEYAENLARLNLNKATIIDAETFDDRLNALMPCRWNHGEFFESFYVSEAHIGRIFSFYVRIKDIDNHYFEVNADVRTTDSELKQICLEAMKEESEAA